MVDDNKILHFRLQPPEYDAIICTLRTSEGYEIKVSGTLDGFIDFHVTTSNSSLGYLLDPSDAKAIIRNLTSVVEDIEKNCLYEKDPRLID